MDLSLIPRRPQQAQVEVLVVQDNRVDSEDEEPPELLEDETQVMFLNTFALKTIPELESFSFTTILRVRIRPRISGLVILSCWRVLDLLPSKRLIWRLSGLLWFIRTTSSSTCVLIQEAGRLILRDCLRCWTNSRLTLRQLLLTLLR